MKRIGLSALAAIAATLLLVPLPAFAQTPSKPVLYIVHSDACAPCQIFDKIFCNRADFQTALRDACELRELDWAVPDQQASAIAMGVDSLPTYLVYRNGRLVAKHVGFATSFQPSAVERAIEDLMVDLGIAWPPNRGKAKAPAERPGTGDVTTPSKPTEAMVDREARDAITRLATQSRNISEDVKNLRDEVTQSNSSLRSQITESNRQSRTQLESISRTLQKSIESTRSSTREELQTIIRERLADAGSPAQIPGTVDISTEISSDKSAPGATTSKWLRVLAWAGRTGLAIAAPEVAIPGSIGLTVAGLGLRWLMRRRQPKPLGTVENPIRVADNGEVKTETKFVVSETDVLGESFREAIRRVGNTHRESSPHIVDVLKQVDAAATQLAHGKRVTRRPAMAPVSENDP